ncbi:hypothetical protein [Aquimarina longa]|uniref:hypothetical protein n=1 Tax=Aquimarina longa TaxID=1080221 RepID=UPI000780955B|nr:hypothetical protein [Aquimarina longa]
MSNWLDRVRPPKYLRYFFYIVHSFYRSYKSERKEAPVTTILFLAFFHMIGLFSFIFIFFSNYFFEKIDGNIGAFIIVFIIGLSHYILFYKKEKWKFYLIEFEHLKKKDRRKGAVYLFIIIILLIFSGWIIMQTSPYYK